MGYDDPANMAKVQEKNIGYWRNIWCSFDCIIFTVSVCIAVFFYPAVTTQL